MTQALASYPPYAPPEWRADPDPEVMRAASAQYREYFLGSRQARLEALRAFLINFDVCLNLDDDGLMAISGWLPRWADLLIDDFSDLTLRDAYCHLALPWTGKRTGLNVIFDLGIYYAECLWARRTKLEWKVYRGRDVHGDVLAGHCILGLPGGKWFDPIDYMYGHCWRIRKAKIAEKKGARYVDTWILKSDSLCRHVLAKTPPGRRSRKSSSVLQV